MEKLGNEVEKPRKGGKNLGCSVLGLERICEQELMRKEGAYEKLLKLQLSVQRQEDCIKEDGFLSEEGEDVPGFLFRLPIFGAFLALLTQKVFWSLLGLCFLGFLRQS